MLIQSRQTFRALFWDYIVENKDTLKGGYKYEFKYVPHHDAKTGAETADGPRPTNGVGHLEVFGLVGFSIAMLLATGLLTIVAKLGFSYMASNPLQAIIAGSPLKP